MVCANIVGTIMVFLLLLFAASRLYYLYKNKKLNLSTIFDLSLETVVLALLFRLIENIIWR